MCGQPALVFGSSDAEAAVRQRDALGRLALRPPFVERPAADTEIGAHLRDGELVPLPGTAMAVSRSSSATGSAPRCWPSWRRKLSLRTSWQSFGLSWQQDVT